MKTDVSVKSINSASSEINRVARDTPLQYSKRLSEKYDAKIYLKREDLQEVRSYKIRGAYYFLKTLPTRKRNLGVVAASAGNHAQGLASSAAKLKVKAVIFMPVTTPLQKINRVLDFGGPWVEVKLVGRNYDESYQKAKEYCQKVNFTFVHPFEDPIIISGQGTVGKEIFEQNPDIDVLVCPVGGGGLIAGCSVYLKTKNPTIKIYPAEPEKAASLAEAQKVRKPVSLDFLDTFVDGASVRRIGTLNFNLIKNFAEPSLKVPNGKLCTVLIELYQNEGIVAEPAGALSIASLDQIKTEIKGKSVVCILSGGNNDLLRYPEIMEKSLLYEGLKHYFLVQFAQKPGQLKAFLNEALGPTDDIVRFEYMKKTSKEMGPALIGIEFQDKADFHTLKSKMSKLNINFTTLNENDLLFSYLV